jgi:hypothetical protein
MTPEERSHAIFELSRYTGREISSDFIRKTSEHYPAAGIPRFHNLVEGIYKPAGDKYAFCVWSRSAAGQDKEIYPDVLQPQSDGTWIMHYAAKAGDLNSAINSSLFSCMQDKVPVLVIVTSRPRSSSAPARYKLFGAAIVEDFDTNSRRFYIRGCSPLVMERSSTPETKLSSTILQIRNQLIMPFQLHEDRAKYQTIVESRKLAFRQIVLEEYRCQCVVCQSKFLLKQEGKEPLVEAEAAHIISVVEKGPDDPRNGLSLCKRHHWAFDEGLFTITDAQTLRISPSILSAERRKFDLEEYEGESIVSPASEACRPNEKALHWHQKRIFRIV